MSNNNNDLEYKIHRILFKQTGSVDDGLMEVSALANETDKADYDNDIIIADAFKESIKRFKKDQKRDPPFLMPLLYSHVPWNVLGRITDLRESDRGLEMKGVISTLTSLGGDISQLIKDKNINGISIGFSIDSAEDVELRKDRKGEYYRIIKNLTLREISIVAMPCNPASRIDSEGKSIGKSVREKMIENLIETYQMKGIEIPQDKEDETPTEKQVSEKQTTASLKEDLTQALSEAKSKKSIKELLENELRNL